MKYNKLGDVRGGRLLLAAAIGFLTAVLTAQTATAATYYYDNDSSTPGFGTAGGTWAAPTPGPIPGWTTDASGSSVPGSVSTGTGDTLNFGNGATGLGAGTITMSGALSSGSMNFASGSGSIVLSGGTSLTLPATSTITVDNSSDTIATPLAGAATSITKAGTGTLILSGANNTATPALTINAGELQLNGTTFNLGAKVIGVATGVGQVAVLNIVNSSITNSSSDPIGSSTNSIGIVKMSGGNYIKTAGNLNFSGGAVTRTNYSALLMSGGFLSVTAEFDMARDSLGASTYVGLSGGTISLSGFSTVGREGYGVLDISGGTVLRPVAAANRFYMNRSIGSFSHLTVRGTGTLDIEDPLGFWFANSSGNGGSGVVNLLPGGTMTSRIGVFWNGAGMTFGYFNFNGGTLQASGASASWWPNGWTACYVYPGGATVDSQGNNITIGQPFLAPSGGGVTSVTGGTGSGYLAPPVVNLSGDGTGATAVAQLNSSGSITNILVTNPGVNYTTATAIFSGGGGTASGWTVNIGANTATGGFTKLGSGTLTMASAAPNTYQGQTRIAAGTLAISAANYPSASALVITNGATLNADVSGGSATLATPSLTLRSNATLNLSYGVLAGNPFQPAISDVTINTGTAITTSGSNIVINLSGSGFVAGQIKIIKYTGSIGGNGFAAFKLGTLPSGVPSSSQLINNTVDGSIDLVIPLVNLITWNGTNLNWDINTTFNWKDGASLPTTYKQYGTTNIYGDIVTLDDSLSDTSKTNISLTTTLRPTTVNVSGFSTPYVLGGAGKLSGGAFLNMSGFSTLTLTTANDYSGGSTLSSGTVLVGNNSALGTGVVSLAGSQLSSDSTSPRSLANSITLAADSTFGVDATSGALTLSGPVDFGGTVRGLSLNSDVAMTGTASNGGITKSGFGTLTVGNGSSVLSGTTTVSGGKLVLNGGTYAGAVNIATSISQTGIVEIVSANITNTPQVNIGTGPSALGVVKQSGGSFVEEGAVLMGNTPSGSAAYLMSGGYAFFGGDFRLDNLGAIGVVSQTGGTMVTDDYFSMSRDGGYSVYDLSGGLHYRAPTALNRFYMTRSAGSTAQLTIRGTGTLDIEDSLGLGYANNYTFVTFGNVNILTGGTIISKVGFFFGNTGVGTIGTVNFNGGLVQASADAPNFLSGWTSAYVYGGGANLDSQNHSFGIAQPLLVPTGGGVTSITGGTGADYFAPPLVVISGDGVGATAVAQINSSGNVTNVLVTNPGVNYSSASVDFIGGGGTCSGWTANVGANSTSGGVVKFGSGTLTLSGANTYGGLTVVSNGTLVFGPAHTGTGGISVADGATLGALSDSPGASVKLPAATLGVSTGASLLAQFSGVTGNPTTPAGYITNLTLNGPTAVGLLSSGIQPGTIPLFRYTALSGSGSITTGNLPQGVVGTVTNNTATKTIELVVTAVNPLIWTGASSTIWDINISTNWAISASPKTYHEGDSVRFEDGAVSSTVVITQSVNPGGITISNNTQTFTISTTGGGALGGSSGLVKDGTNMVILDGTNTYLGATLINAGNLRIGSGGASGSLNPLSAINIASGATLNFNRSDAVGWANNISGTGILLKNGSGELNLTGTNTFSGTITIPTSTAKVALNGLNSDDGEPSVSANASFSLGAVFVGNTCTIGNLTGSTNGRVDVAFGATAGTRTLQINQTTSGTFNGTLSDGSAGRVLAITKVGAARLTFTGLGAYTGPTLVNNGTLVMDGFLSNSVVTVAAGAAFGGGGTVGNTVSYSAGSAATNRVGTPLTVLTLDLAGDASMKLSTASPISAGVYPLINYTSLTGSGNFTNFTVGGAGLSGGASASLAFTNSSVSLVVVGGSPTPVPITYAVYGNQYVLNWPTGQGWILQSNSVSISSTGSWFDVTGATPPFTNNISPTVPQTYFRLRN